MTSYCILKQPLDDLLLVASETELIGLYFDDHAHVPAGRSTLDPSRQQIRKNCPLAARYGVFCD
jgi:hypothetical protein